MEPIIRFEQISKSFGDQAVLRDFTLDVFPGEFLTIIGRSGCGKTTALKLVNGLVRPDSGRILVQGKDVAGADPVALRRRIGYVIQSVGLFPHMTVEKNIAYVPSLTKRADKKKIAQDVSKWLEIVGLDESLRCRYPSELSG